MLPLVARAAAGELHQRRERAGRRHPEHRAAVIAPPGLSRPVEIPIGAQHQSGFRATSLVARPVAGEVHERRQHACRCDLEDRPEVIGSTLRRRAVEVPINALHQTGVRGTPRGPSRVPGELHEGRQHAAGCHLEHRAAIIGATLRSRPVVIAIAALHQSASGIPALVARAVARKLHQGRQHPAGRHLEHRAVAIGPAINGRAVETPVAAQDQTGKRVIPLVARPVVGEFHEGRERPARRHLEHRAIT